MAYYVLVKDGVLQGLMLTNPYGIVPGDWTVSEMDGAMPDLNTHTWDSENGEFIRRDNVMSKLEFLSRFTLQERTLARSSADPIINDILKMLDLAEIVDLNYPPTIQGVHYMSMIGLLTPERVQEVLS